METKTYIKMCDCPEIQKRWKPNRGDQFFTSCSSLSYAYGGMGEKEAWQGHEDDEPKLPNLKDGNVCLLTDQPVDSGYYGWSIGDSFPDEKSLLKYFIWLPRQDQIQEMMDWKSMGISGPLYQLEAIDDWSGTEETRLRRSSESIAFDDKYDSLEKCWLAFYMNEKHKKTWDGEKWIAELQGGKDAIEL